MSLKRYSGAAFGTALVVLIAPSLVTPAMADKIAHPTAVFSGLDKITGRIISFEVATNETVQFGSLQITERACYTRPATEAPQTITFAQVDEIDAKKQYKRIFSGWMFASSPGLNGIEHPVYDIWLTDCKGGTTVIKAAPDTAAAEPSDGDPGAKPDQAAKSGQQAKDQQTKDQQAKDQQAKADQQAAKAERRRRRAEAAAAKRRQAQEAQDPNFDNPPSDTPQRDPNRAPPARSFFPDAAGGRDPGGFY